MQKEGCGIEEIVDTIRRSCTFLVVSGMLIRLTPGKAYQPFLRFLAGMMMFTIFMEGICQWLQELGGMF